MPLTHFYFSMFLSKANVAKTGSSSLHHDLVHRVGMGVDMAGTMQARPPVTKEEKNIPNGHCMFLVDIDPIAMIFKILFNGFHHPWDL